MKNRYDNVLREHNQDILSLAVYNPFLFVIAAGEIARIYKQGMRVLEIGCGEGDSALPMLERTKASIDLLDVSKEMLAICKRRLKKYAGRTTYVRKDALEHLAGAKPYGIIFSAWTVHNFTQPDKRRLFRAIHANLAPGGAFVLMDKVYPPKGGRALLRKQNARYARYLEPKVAKAIIAHETEDATDKYRMDERAVLKELKKAGFRSAKLIERVQRETVIIARKG